mmetsp:Transcript_6165/g.9043  ORF Transcript_6165/g.9043 Transcript_6165/m.9043 type:complete len:495 (-) Transcript_6165:521-2005(-)
MMETKSDSHDDSLDIVECHIESFESVNVDAALNVPGRAAEDSTYTSFNYHSDSDDDITDQEKTNSDFVDDEHMGHHSLPTYPPLDAYNSNTKSQNRLSSISQSLCGKSFSLYIFFAVAVVICSIALILTNGKGSLVKKSSWWSSAEWAALPVVNRPLYSLAFGSCSDQTRPMTYWDTVTAIHPDLTILMGDNVYGDCDDSSCETLKEAYDMLASDPSFLNARANLPMIATLDDHDYGRNDADVNNPVKDEAKEMFLDFFAVPSNDERRRVNDGVYTSYEWGPKSQRIQVIILDVRYFHSESKPTDDYGAPFKERYIPDHDKEKRLMSQEQWRWLGELLARPANVRLIVSSIQVISDGTGFECWRMLPYERERLYNVLQPTLKKTRTVILSGDRHIGGFYKHQTDDLYEVTASSWTHTIPYGMFDDCTNAQECDEKDPRRINDFVRVNHFGMINLDWDNREISIGLRRAETSEAVNEKGDANSDDLLQYHVLSIP